DAIQKIASIPTNKPVTPLYELQTDKSNFKGLMAILKDPVRLVRTLGGTTVRSLRSEDGTFKTYLPVLKAIMMPGILPGDTFDGFRQRLIGSWTTASQDILASKLNT